MIGIVVVCIAALIIISAKRKALEKESVEIKAVSEAKKTERGYDVSGYDAKTEAAPVSKDSGGAKKKTLYEFSVKGKRRRCPYCDGEISTKAKICEICGRDL
ncbi:MAG: hypothetical protein IKM13_01925 [Clostridia bacterium]|nr:hypothetical protein [Clostridia bacterium]